jgi:hypothetical protein
MNDKRAPVSSREEPTADALDHKFSQRHAQRPSPLSMRPAKTRSRGGAYWQCPECLKQFKSYAAKQHKDARLRKEPCQ